MKKGLADPGVRLVVQAWVGSRLLVVIAAVIVLITQPQSRLDQMLRNWDVIHFIKISQEGYLAANSEAFFPGLPVLLRLGATMGVDEVVTGLALSAIGSILASWALYRLGGPLAAVAWLLAPTAVFTVVGYTESLFCAAAFWAWERARAKDHLSMALLAALACSVRVSGLFLVGALAILLLTQSGSSVWKRLVRCLWLLIPAGVLLAYAYYLYRLTGSWTAWFEAQSTGWARELTNPIDALINTVRAAAPGAFPNHWGWAWMFRFELISVAVGLVTTGVCLLKRRWAEASWVGVQILAFSLSYWFQSVSRAVLLWFPLWILLGAWAAWRPAVLRARRLHAVAVLTAVTTACIALTAWAWMYFSGYWAG